MKRKGLHPRCSGLIRVLTLLRMLEGHGRYTLEELAVRFVVSTRTIRRDLVAIQAAGYPLGHEERGEGDGYWWMAA